MGRLRINRRKGTGMTLVFGFAFGLGLIAGFALLAVVLAFYG